MPRKPIENPKAAVEAARALILDFHKEHFIGLYLDSHNYAKRSELISMGTINAALVHPRETFRPALVSRAVEVILLHNHPSGKLEPSEEDLAMTKGLHQAADLLGIELLDHLIFDRSKNFYSFREHELLQ